MHIRENVTITQATDIAGVNAGSELIERWKELTKNGVRVNSVVPGKKGVNAVINVPDSGGVTVTVIGGVAAARIDLVLRSPIQEVLVQDANNNHGFMWDTTGLPQGTALDIGMIYYYWSETGSEYGCDVERINDSTYILGFEDRGVAPMYVDLIVQVVLGTPHVLDHFKITAVPDTIHWQDAATILVQAGDAADRDINISSNTQMKITGDDCGNYGDVERYDTWVAGEVYSYAEANGGMLLYYAGGENPSGIQRGSITC